MPDDAGLVTPVSDLETRVRALEWMKLNELREVWQLEWGAPPKLRSLALLRMICEPALKREPGPSRSTALN